MPFDYSTAHWYRSWLDRIPFVLLFGVATSVDIFEGHLPRSTVDLLQGQGFDIRESVDSIDRIFFDSQGWPDNIMWFGHGVSKLLVERSRDGFQSPEVFSDCLKVCA